MPRWAIQCDAHVPAGWIAAIRLSEHNKAVLDYVLLPTDGKLKRTIRFSEAGRERHAISCFKTPDALVRAITRRLTRQAHASRATQVRLSKQQKAGQPRTKIGLVRR